MYSRIGLAGSRKGNLIFSDGCVLIDEDGEYIDFDNFAGELIGCKGTIELIINPRKCYAID